MQVLEKLSLITQRILRGDPLNDVLAVIVEEAVAFCRAERGFLILKTPQVSGPIPGMEIRIARGKMEETSSEAELPSQTALLKGLESKDVLVTDNAVLEEPFHKAPSVMKLKLKAILVIPIHGADGISGAIYLDHRYQSLVFRDLDTQILKLFADQAALALQKLT